MTTKQLLVVLVLSGGLGSATGAGTANVLGPAEVTLHAVDARLAALTEEIQKHNASPGHPDAVSKLSALDRKEEEREKESRRFFEQTWSDLQHTLGSILARLSQIERQLR